MRNVILCRKRAGVNLFFVQDFCGAKQIKTPPAAIKIGVTNIAGLTGTAGSLWNAYAVNVSRSDEIVDLKSRQIYRERKKKGKTNFRDVKYKDIFRVKTAFMPTVKLMEYYENIAK